MTAAQTTTKKTTAKKAPARKAPAKKRAAKKSNDEAIVEQAVEALRKVMMASLGAYGETVDDLKARVEVAKKDSSTRYDKLVVRGEKIQKETKKKIDKFEMPKPEVKENLDKMRDGINDLLDTLFKAEKKKPAKKKAA